LINQSSPANAPLKELRGFGIGMTLFCAFLGGVLFWRGHPHVSYVLWIIGALVFLIPAMLSPGVLRPIFIAWTAVALRLNWVISRLILCLLFYGMFTLVSIVQKIIKRDPLDRKFPGEGSTYWIDRSQETYNPKHFERLF
jgi:hypothetical protein